MRDYWVYMVLCDDASYYIGITNDVERRVYEHNIGFDQRCYTFTRRPVELVYRSRFNDPESAIRWEKQLKGWSRAKKRALAAGDFAQVSELAKGRVLG